MLTTIDVEPEHQRLAKQAFAEAGIGAVADQADRRARPGSAAPGSPTSPTTWCSSTPIPSTSRDFVVEGVRLLRSGGAIVVHRAALGGRAGDATAATPRSPRCARPPA